MSREETRYGLLGEKLGHSFSPQIHAMLGLKEYDLFAVPKEEFDAFMERRSFQAVNVTIPYKKAVIPYLTSISPQARAIGSVNTIVKDQDGRLHGYNTDYFGLAALARRTGISFAGKKVLVLGSGGTSLTARAVARDGGAAELIVISRQGEDNYENLEKHKNAQIVINTTPVGMYPKNGEAPLSLAQFPALEGVLDVIYNPYRTALIEEAEHLGIPCASGLYMLVAQAKYAEDLFFGREIAPDGIIDEVYAKLLSAQQNLICLCTEDRSSQEKAWEAAKALAEQTGKRLCSLDQSVEETSGYSVAALTQKFGKVRLFAERRQAAMALGKEHGQIILAEGLEDGLRDSTWQRMAEPVLSALLQNGEISGSFTKRSQI